MDALCPFGTCLLYDIADAANFSFCSYAMAISEAEAFLEIM